MCRQWKKCIRAARDLIPDEVFECTKLVSAESQTGVAILALDLKFAISTDSLGQTWQVFNGGLTAGEWFVLERVRVEPYAQAHVPFVKNSGALQPE